MRPLYFISKMDVDDSGMAKLSTHRIIDILDEEDIILSAENKPSQAMMNIIREAEAKKRAHHSKATISCMPAISNI